MNSKNRTHEIVYEEDIVSELTEEDKKTVEKCHRQLSVRSVLSIRSQDDELDDHGQEAGIHDERDDFTEEEALRLQRVINAFQNYKNTKTDHIDETDGKNYKRLSSNQSNDFLLATDRKGSSSDSRFVSPGRFHVIISEESKAIVREVNEMIQRGKKSMTRTQSTEVLVVQNEQFYSSNPNNYRASAFEESILGPGEVKVKISDNSSWYNGRIPHNSYIERNRNGHAMLTVPNNRHANFGFLMMPHLLSPKGKFRWAVRRVIRLNREKWKEEKLKKRKDYFDKLWKRRGDVGWWSLLLCLVGPMAFLADSATDLKVASDHISSGHPWWGTFTLMLVFFPIILVNIVSYFFYKDDQELANRRPESGWKIVKITHFLQVGLIERYWRILKKAYKIKFKKPNDVETYQLYIAMNLDAAMLQMILAFTEDAPQLVLQLYVLIRRKLVEKLISTSIQDIWTTASICFSFISYSRAVVNYMSCLRDSKKYKGVLRWYGYIAMWFWRAFMFTSRVLVLVFFATEFHLWFFLVLASHFVLMLLLIWSHKVNFFLEQTKRQILIRVVVAYIHTFCFFVLDAHKTIRWAVQFYLLIGLEAVIFSTMWFTNSTQYVSKKFEVAGMAVIFLCFGMGLLMMIIYYKLLHPKFKRPQTKWYTKAPPKEELCEDVKNEDEDEDGENVEHADETAQFPKSVKQVELWLY